LNSYDWISELSSNVIDTDAPERCSFVGRVTALAEAKNVLRLYEQIRAHTWLPEMMDETRGRVTLLAVDYLLTNRVLRQHRHAKRYPRLSMITLAHLVVTLRPVAIRLE